jgi:hypothetical protein
MATCRMIQDEIRRRHGYVAKTCWIAAVKRTHGLTRGPSPNRRDPHHPLHPCPAGKVADIEAALRRFRMI